MHQNQSDFIQLRYGYDTLCCEIQEQKTRWKKSLNKLLFYVNDDTVKSTFIKNNIYISIFFVKNIETNLIFSVILNLVVK